MCDYRKFGRLLDHVGLHQVPFKPIFRNTHPNTERSASFRWLLLRCGREVF